MPRHARHVPIAVMVLAAALSGCQATPAGESAADEVNFEGLATVPSRRFDLVQVRPQADLRAYTRIVIEAPELAYRTPDRALREFALSDEQKTRFSESLRSAFDREFARLESLERAEAAGPGTLALGIRVQDIVASVEPRSVGQAGRGAALLEASGDAVIVVELRDSQSNEILARGVDAGTASGGALRTPEGELRARFESAEKIAEKWAAIARAGLENLLSEGR